MQQRKQHPANTGLQTRPEPQSKPVPECPSIPMFHAIPRPFPRPSDNWHSGCYSGSAGKHAPDSLFTGASTMPRHSIPAALPTFAEYRRQPDFGTSIDHDRDDWLIAPCQQDRDSDTLTRSNFAVMVSELERIEQDAQTEGAEYFDIFELHRFGHWGPGWIEIVLVRPGTAAAEYVAELADSLADYPVADESHFSQLESDEAAESWESWGASVFKRAIRAKFRDAAPFVVECIDDTATDEQLREWMEELYPNEPYYFDCGECNFPIDRAVSNCGRDELAAFAWKLRGDLRGE